MTNRIRDELHVKAESGTFLPKIEEFHFTSTNIPYAHCAFFALQSLKRIVSMKDTGAWSTILDPGYDIGTWNPRIEELSLKSTALVPSDLAVIRRSFPGLMKFEARNNPHETNRQVFPGGLPGANSNQQNLSATLAKMRNLSRLSLELDPQKAPGLAQANFMMQLGPVGGINSLGRLDQLTELQIGMHHLMCYRGENSQRKARPLPPTVLPPALKRLRLYTCLSCWNPGIAGLLPDAEEQPLLAYIDESTFIFVASLATHVSTGTGLPHLEDVRLYSQTSWWLLYGGDSRTVRHCTEEKGQIWNAGGLEYFCGISRFEKRTPGIHFRAYRTDEFDCGRARPDDDCLGMYFAPGLGMNDGIHVR